MMYNISSIFIYCMEYLPYVFCIQIYYIAAGGDKEEARVVQQGAREARAVQQGAVSGSVGLCRSVGTSSSNVFCTACGRLPRASDAGFLQPRLSARCRVLATAVAGFRRTVMTVSNRSTFAGTLYTSGEIDLPIADDRYIGFVT